MGMMLRRYHDTEEPPQTPGAPPVAEQKPPHKPRGK